MARLGLLWLEGGAAFFVVAFLAAMPFPTNMPRWPFRWFS
jgi:hypothetical protein